MEWKRRRRVLTSADQSVSCAMANALDAARKALDSILGKLGFEYEIEVVGEPEDNQE